MGQSIIIGSGKGGVGKTSVAINLGVALAKLGKKVVIVDGSLTTPDVSLHLGIPFHVMSISHVLKQNVSLESATFNHKSGVRIIPGNVHIDVLKEFEGEKFSKVLKKLKKEHDFVLVDCAAGLGREAVSAIRHCDKMVIVANPEVASIVNSSKAIETAKSYKVEPVGVILNRVGRFKQELKEENIQPLLHNVPIIGQIPEDKKVAVATKKLEAIVDYYPDCKVSKEFKKIACGLAGKEIEQEDNFLSKIFGFFKKY